VTNSKFYSLRRYSIEVRLGPFGIEAFVSCYSAGLN